MDKPFYRAVVQIGKASAPIGYTDDKDEFLMYAESAGIKLENIRFIPAPQIGRED